MGDMDKALHDNKAQQDHFVVNQNNKNIVKLRN